MRGQRVDIRYYSHHHHIHLKSFERFFSDQECMASVGNGKFAN
jgi:hypothetical protein